MTAETSEEAFIAPTGGLRLWYGTLIGAFAWKLQLVVNYAVVPYACWHRAEWINHVASFAMGALALTGCWVSWRSWQRTGGGWETDVGGPVGRARFMALCGIALSALFAFHILGQWIPNLFLSPCDGLG
jgi:hypothetical protein